MDSGGAQSQEGPRSAGRGSSARGGGRETARARASGIPAGDGAAPAAPRANVSSAASAAPPSAGAIDIPDAEDMASPGQAEITGMDLIQRELGGQIIGEIEE
jgi:DNA polymerase-3 subunit gamma/tau